MTVNHPKLRTCVDVYTFLTLAVFMTIAMTYIIIIIIVPNPNFGVATCDPNALKFRLYHKEVGMILTFCQLGCYICWFITYLVKERTTVAGRGLRGLIGIFIIMFIQIPFAIGSIMFLSICQYNIDPEFENSLDALSKIIIPTIATWSSVHLLGTFCAACGRGQHRSQV